VVSDIYIIGIIHIILPARLEHSQKAVTTLFNHTLMSYVRFVKEHSLTDFTIQTMD